MGEHEDGTTRDYHLLDELGDDHWEKVTVEDIDRLLFDMRLGPEQTDPHAFKMFDVETGDRYRVFCAFDDDDRDHVTSLLLQACFDEVGILDERLINNWNRHTRWCRAYMESENRVYLEHDVPALGDLLRTLGRHLHEFLGCMRSFSRALDHLRPFMD